MPSRFLPQAPSPCDDPVIGVYATHAGADAALATLLEAGMDMKKLSLVCKGCHTQEHALGFYTSGKDIRTWGSRGAFSSALWSLMAGSAVFVLPRVGLIAIAGPLSHDIVNALDGSRDRSGRTAFKAALIGLGVAAEQASAYEADLQADRILVVHHGAKQDICKARHLLAKRALAAQPVCHQPA